MSGVIEGVGVQEELVRPADGSAEGTSLILSDANDDTDTVSLGVKQDAASAADGSDQDRADGETRTKVSEELSLAVFSPFCTQHGNVNAVDFGVNSGAMALVPAPISATSPTF